MYYKSKFGRSRLAGGGSPPLPGDCHVAIAPRNDNGRFTLSGLHCNATIDYNNNL